MNSKKINKTLNTILALLIILIIGIYGQQKLEESYSVPNIKEEVNNNSKLEIYFFDVGQADSILIKEKENTVLIDAGNNEDGKNLVNYIREDLNISNIDILVGTHPHEDHIGGIDDIIDSFDIGKIYLPNVTTTTKTFESVLDSIENKKYRITIPKVDETIKLENMNFRVIYTGEDESDLNNSSIVLKLTYFNTSYLFTGDIEEEVEKIILNKDIASDVLKVGHHGSKYSTSDKFLNLVNPKHAIIEVGKNNSYKHPHEETLTKLKNKDIEVYRTDELGTIKLISDGTNINIDYIKTNLDG
ncbi:MAG: MBL fold metallo-hydrolase [Bacilli bacterium]|nr:MBL fold metallo-hydrolase [Bacilli bacterium]